MYLLGTSIFATGSLLFKPGWEKAEILHKAVFVNILVLKTEQNELTIFMYLNFLEVIPTTFV